MSAARRRPAPRAAGAALLALALLSVLFAAPAPGHAVVRRAPADRDDAALKLLRRSADAARTRAYTGVQFLAAWSGGGTSTSVIDITHRPGHGITMRVRGTVNDPSGGAYVLDDPGQAQAPAGGLAGPSDEQLSLLERNYTVRTAAGGADAAASVGGRAARVVEARRADGSVAARFCLDSSDDLLLRREVFDTSGRLVQASAFTSLELHGGDVPAATARPRRPWGDRLGGPEIAKLRRAGWTIPAALPGGLSLYDVRRGGGASAPVLHLGYSDGLSVVSLFVQRGRLDGARLTGWRRVERHRGVLYVSGTVQQRLTWAARGYVYTVFADAPGGVTEKVVAALPHETRPGFWTRIGHGLDRVVSWLNPFG